MNIHPVDGRMLTDQQYPQDENGDVLRQMAEDGIDLVSPRLMEFEHLFPDQAAAERFRDAVATHALAATISPPDDDEDRGWQVTCRERMVPTHGAITEAELRLAALAKQCGGRADGWGSMSNADGSPSE